MEKVLERLKEELEKNCLDEEIQVNRHDLTELIQEYEIATGRKKRWEDERW
ncbi:hypothetical protein [Bacillus sp. LL01]|uniref:hypothetical protein n=1 Tax=Bacillus sp. LL01 TaxID=1665556 RepID=UPI000B312A9E|nr:hypothetical protein [Bacillus sp. LL01]